MELSAAREHYVHETLDYGVPDRHPIRLLRILPGEPGSLVSCELFRTYITSNGEEKDIATPSVKDQSRHERNLRYTALSYVWGDPTVTTSIQVNGKVHRVTTNLWMALQRHRDTFLPKENDQSLFWIDAICIDQTNVEERSTQVAFMAEIYKEADHVLVWLGEESAESSMAFQTLAKMTAEYELSTWEYSACQKTFGTGWWRRLWVVQEVYHARKIVVRCGAVEIDWEFLVEKEIMSPAALMEVFLLESVRMYRGERTPQSVLDWFGSRECYDSKDAVFALRSLAPALMSVQPDYSLCTADVFTSITRAIICKQNDLDVLKFTSRRRQSRGLESKDLPSWVPDWGMEECGYLGYKSDYQASKDRNISHETLSHKNTDVLLLVGIVCDIAVFTTSDWVRETGQSNPRKKSESTVVQLKRWFLDCSEDFIRQNCNPKLNLNAIIDDFFRHRGYPVPAFKKQESFIRDTHLDLEGRSFEGHSFVITESGMKGFVLGTPRVGDIVFVAYGSNFPLVLRVEDENEPSYSLVGCAVIEELMAGEAVDMMEAGKLDEQTILLR